MWVIFNSCEEKWRHDVESVKTEKNFYNYLKIVQIIMKSDLYWIHVKIV